ncbi:twin-arginine translocation pathway signal protein [Pseudomonas sp. L-22-4S-12]|uniref:dioxygenase family protein n=1 Tax=Pseudomonas sp. L-22-4S-12 TaxID=2610893 RepID=UPI00132345AF|nr:twin-arginine translocation pathway signal protein [Pseudomonas sp. L-22-4S-12]MWV17949.1 twin-arginine translocation pathway signal protein [Pseudomonas sp. L-22-4S-12]
MATRPAVGAGVSRRHFLQGSALLLGGGLLARPGLAGALCRPTRADILGPYYRFGAPFLASLAGAGEPGERLVVTGRVLSADCRTPLPNALVEVWQANSQGLYDTQTPGNFTDRGQFHLRGMLYTDGQGRYRIETVLPGRYPVPSNLPRLERYAGITRPAHIHFRVMESLHVPVTLQLYFAGDPYIPKDPWAQTHPDNVIELKSEAVGRSGVFDIVLARGL